MTLKTFLLGTSDYVRGIQSDIDLYVTRGRHNQVIFLGKLDPIEKSVWRTENPLALLVKDIANFDAQNPIIGSLLREIDLGKRSTNSNSIKKSLSKAPDINDTILLQRFEKFKEIRISITVTMMMMTTIMTIILTIVRTIIIIIFL